MTRNVPTLKGMDLKSMFESAVSPVKSHPWDSVVDFATDPSFCGNKLYPRQQTLLKLIYLEREHMTQYDTDVIGEWSRSFADKAYTIGVQEDIWDRVDYLRDQGYDHFRQVQGVMGRRASKGHIGGILFNERMSHLVTLDDPQSHFGIETGHDIYFLVVATSTGQALKFLFADVVTQVRKNAWLRPYIVEALPHIIRVQTPADMRRTAELIAQGTPPRRPITSVNAEPVSTNSATVRGSATFVAGFDEFAFSIGGDSSRSGNAVYSAVEPSLDQFGKEALIYMPSSPWTKVGKFYELYQAGSVLLDSYLERMGQLKNGSNRSKLEEQIVSDARDSIIANPEMLIVQLESWGLYKDWEQSAWLLSKPSRSYEKREATRSGLTELELRSGARAVVKGENALDIGDSIIHGRSVDTIDDLQQVNEVKDGELVLDDWRAVDPGPRFQGAIQVVPDPNGDQPQRSMAAMESRDRNLFRVERRGQFVTTQNAYLDSDKVEAVFAPFWGDRELEQQNHGRIDRQYLLHCDPAKSGADFALMLGHTELSPYPDSDGKNYRHLIIDQHKVYQGSSYEDGIVDYLDVIKDIQDIIRRFPTLKSISMDQFNSVMPLQEIRKYADSLGRRLDVSEFTFTASSNQRMYSALKTAVNLGWIHAPTDDYFDGGKGCLLEQEMKFLEEVNGRVTKQKTGLVSHDDLVDCLGVLVVKLLSGQVTETTETLDAMSVGIGLPAGIQQRGKQAMSDAASRLNSLYE